MKKIAGIFLFVLAAALIFSATLREGINYALKGNMGLDDLSRRIEVSISQNPAAAAVFGMDDGQAVQVFGRNAE